MTIIPQPPKSNNATEYVVVVFVVTVASILVISTLALIVLAAINPDRDYSTLTNSLLDIVTTVIGALIGFIAGKGQGRAEMHDDIASLREPPRADDKT